MYSTVDLATTYLTTRLGSEAWVAATPEKRTQYLVEAGDLVDRLAFLGTKTNSSQEHEFPRNGSATVPTDILYAVYEIAKNLASGRNIEYENELAGRKTTGFGMIKRETHENVYSEATLHNIPSVKAWNLLRPYMVDGQSLTLVRR